MLGLFCFLAQLTLAQQTLDAFVKIIDNDRAGERAIYRFTVLIGEGATYIQSFLPQDVQLDSQSKPSICGQFLVSSVQPFNSCEYIESSNMIRFKLPEGFEGFLVYDIGYLINPSYSSYLFDFKIQALSNSLETLAESAPFMVYVQIYPNVITEQSLQVGSLQIAAKTTYLFKLRVSNAVPLHGFLHVTFPTTQIAVPGEDPESALSLDGGKTWQRVEVLSISSTSITLSVAQEIEAGTLFQLRMKDINNPNTMAETDSFEISTMTADFRIIDKVSTGLTVDCNEAAGIRIDSISIEPKKVGSRAQLIVKLTLPTKYSEGGYLKITLPKQLSFDQQFLQCFLLMGFNSDYGYCEVVSPQQIILTDVISRPELTFMITGILNPPNTAKTDTFFVEAYDPFNQKIAASQSESDYGYQPIPGMLYSVVAIRGVNVVGQLTDLTVEFVTQNTLMTGEKVMIEIPTTHFQQPNAVVCNAKTQFDSSLSLSVPCDFEKTEGYFKLTYSVNCDNNRQKKLCSGGTKHTFWLENLINLDWIQEVSQSIKITTLTADLKYLIDQKTSSIKTMPLLVEGEFSQIWVKKEEGVVYQPTQLEFSLSTQNKIGGGGYFTLEFENDSLQEGDQLIGKLKQPSYKEIDCSATLYPQSTYIKEIKLNNICVNGCQKGETIQVQLSGLNNPKSIRPLVNRFTFRSFTQLDQAIDQFVFTNASGLELYPGEILEAVLLEPVSPTIITTGALQDYKFSITPKNGIEPKYGKLVLTLPIENKLSPSSSCTAQVAKTFADLQCQPSQNTLVITHSKKETFAQDEIIITALKVQNSPTTKESSFASATSYLRTQDELDFYTVDEKVEAFTTKANKPNTLVDVRVERSVDVVNLQTELTICCTPFNPVPKDALITIGLSDDQVRVDGTVRARDATFVSKAQNELIVRVVDSVYQKQESCFVLTGNIYNPPTTQPPTNSLKIEIRTRDNYQIDEKISDIFATPFLSAGPFNQVDMRLSQYTIGKPTELQVDVQLQSSLLDRSYFYLHFPVSTFYFIEGGEQLAFTINRRVKEECIEVVTQQDELGLYVEQLKIQTRDRFISGQDVTFTIYGLINKHSTAPLLSSITVQSMDSDLYSINSSQFALSEWVYQPNTDGRFTLARKTLNVQSMTDILIQVELQTPIKEGSKMQIFLPQYWFTSPSNPRVYVDNFKVSLTQQQRDSNYELEFSLPSTTSSQIVLKVSGFRNRYSTDANLTQKAKIQTLTNDNFVIDVLTQSEFDDQLLPALIKASDVLVSNLEIGGSTVFTTVLQFDGYVEKGNIFTFRSHLNTFLQPEPFRLLFNQNLQETTPIPAEQGFFRGFEWTFPEQQNQKFGVNVANLRNLHRKEPLDFKLEFEIRTPTGGLVFVGESTFNQLDILESVYFSYSKLERSNSLVNAKTELAITFEVQNIKIGQNAKVEIEIPSQELELSDESCQGSVPCSLSQGDEFIKLTLENVCPFTCLPASLVTLQVTKGLKNPSQPLFTNKFSTMFLSSDGYSIAKEREGIQLTPILMSAEFELSELSFEHIGKVAGSQTTLVFRFNMGVSNEVPLQQISLILPQDSFIYQEEPACFTDLSSTERLQCEVSRTTFKVEGEPQFALQLQLTQLQSKILPNQLQSIVVKNLRNSDKPSDFQKDKEVSITLITYRDLILATGFVELRSTLEPAEIAVATFDRSDTFSGTEKVKYYLTFITQSYIREKHHLKLLLPTEVALADQWQLKCEDVNSERNVRCRLEDFDEQNQILTIAQWCRNSSPTKENLCMPGQELRLQIILSNPPRIKTSGLKAQLQVWTAQDEITAVSNLFLAEPPLSGLGMLEPSIRRASNVLGGVDEQLIIFVRELKASVLTDTDLLVELPDGLIYPSSSQQLNCIRVFSKEAKVLCSITDQYESGAIHQIKVKSFCSQTLICMNQNSLELHISGLTNPKTNSLISTQVDISLHQDQLEIGFVAFDSNLALMQAPQTNSIETSVPTDCKTFMVCQLEVKMIIQNPLKNRDYILFKSPFTLLSTSCSIVSDVSARCFIDNNTQIRVVALSDIQSLEIAFQAPQALMTTTTDPVTQFSAESFEVLNGRASELEKFSGGQILLKPSLFRQLTTKRTITTLKTNNELRVFLRTRNRASGDSVEIMLPKSVGLTDQAISCVNGRDISIPCYAVQQAQNSLIRLDQFNNWCENSDIQCLIVIKNVRNPDSIMIGDEEEIQITFKSGQWLVHQQSERVEPKLQPAQLVVTNYVYLPNNKMQTGEKVDFQFEFESNNKKGEFMAIEWDITRFALQYSNIYRPKVKVGEEMAEIIDLQKGQDNLVSFLLFALPPIREDKTTVLITGFLAPNYVKDDRFNLSTFTLTYLETPVYQIASTKLQLQTTLSPSVFSPIVAYSTNPFVNQLTELHFSFNLKPQLPLGKVILNLPSGYLIQLGFECADLITQEQVSCKVPDHNSIVIDIPSEVGRPYSGFSFKIGMLKHPSTVQKQQFELTLVNYQGLFATATFEIETMLEQYCPSSSNCTTCTSAQTCTACQPGYVLNQGQCQVYCDANMFEIDGRCYRCHSDCLQCQRQDSCSVCPNEYKSINGLCLSECPLGYIDDLEGGCIYSSEDRLVECKPTSKRETFQIIAKERQTLDESVCDAVQVPLCQSSCQSCALNPLFCNKCFFGSLQDGQCVQRCQEGYFSHNSTCYKCSPVCDGCDSNANQCTTCREGLLWIEGYQTCAMECPVGTYPTREAVDKPISICAQCHPSCNSCNGEVCTTCYRHFETQVDLYLSEGQCVESCPLGMEVDYEQHRCVVPAKSSLRWSLPLGVVGLIFVYTLTRMSKCKSKESNSTYVGSAVLNLVDFFNRCLLMCTLWSTLYVGCFVIAGFYTFASSLAGIYESQMVIIKERNNLQSFLTSSAGPFQTRWILGNAFGKYSTVKKEELDLTRYTESCQYQTILTFIYTLGCILTCLVANRGQACFGIAVNGIMFSVVQLLLQLRIKCEKKQNGQAPVGDSVLEHKMNEDQVPLSSRSLSQME